MKSMDLKHFSSMYLAGEAVKLRLCLAEVQPLNQ